MNRFLTSKAVERATDLSGSYLRKLVRAGLIQPDRDSTGRYLYTKQHVDQIIALRARKRSS